MHLSALAGERSHFLMVVGYYYKTPKNVILLYENVENIYLYIYFIEHLPLHLFLFIH